MVWFVRHRRKSRKETLGSTLRNGGNRKSKKLNGKEDNAWAGPVTIGGEKDGDEGADGGVIGECDMKEDDQVVLKTFTPREEAQVKGVGADGSKEAQKWAEAAPLLFIDDGLTDEEEKNPLLCSLGLSRPAVTTGDYTYLPCRMSVSSRCLCFVKYLMFIFNLVFWLGGCGLFGVGVWLSFTQSKFSALPLSFPSLSAANLLLVAGGVTMVTGFLGCLGALKEQRCLLMTFFTILLLLVITEVTLVVVLYVFREKLDRKAQDELKRGMSRYTSDEGLRDSWDSVQRMFKCCGVNNKNDWHHVMNNTLPASCCSANTEPCNEEWSEPCYRKARDWLLDNIHSVLIFGVCIGIIQILALGFSMLMYCQILRAEKYLD
ncbi:Tetraspanin-4-like [Arapaima gigas]